MKSHFEFSFCQKMKSERPVSKELLCCNRLGQGQFVRIRSIHVGLSGFLKHVVTLIKLFRQLISQTFFIEFSSIPTLKSSMEMRLS